MKLALGTAQFGQSYGVANTLGQVPLNEVRSILEYCKAVGINTIDTAIDYGTSEECLGLVGINGFDVITKIPAIPGFCPDVNLWLNSQIESSMTRLNVQNLHGVMLHRPEQLFEPFGESLLQSLIKAKDAGQVNKIGVSVYDPNELKGLYALYDFDIVQVPFNVVDRRLVTTGWLEKLRIKGVEVHSRSCFLQGLLVMSEEEIPEKFNSWKNLWSEWYGWLEEHDHISAVEACMAFVNSVEGVDKIVIGIDSQDQLEQLVTTLEKNIQIKVFPNISSDHVQLINPSKWITL